MDMRAQGADDLALLARRLRETGDKGNRKELYSGLRRAARPLIEDARQEARARLPREGGLNERVATAKFRVGIRGGGRSPGVRITGTGEYDLRAIDRGRVRHKVFGKWRPNTPVQLVPPGWFTDPMEAGADASVRAEVLKVVDDIARKVAGP